MRAQTAALAANTDTLVTQLRSELALPAVATGSPALVLLMGYPGAGKTHVARLLASRLGAAHIATDHIRSRLFVAASYAQHENDAVFAAARTLLGELLGEGHTVILDATHLRAAQRAPAEAVARSAGARVVRVLVTSDETAARARLLARARERAEGDHSDADLAVYERMRGAGFEAPRDGFVELVNGADLEREIARIVAAVEAP